ncbi:FecR family protein [Formosa sp. 3Alg 14/1]|uniref:FecR family protein n=1 Tax=Formosa sp. 3Alg 14/1 TaxID=3382190 RepID=UPI0039BE7C61
MENQIETLIVNSFTKPLSEKDQAVLDSWIEASVDNKNKFEAYKELWEKSSALASAPDIDVEAALIKTKKRINDFRFKRLKRMILPVAAMLIVLLGFTFFMKRSFNQNSGINSSEDIVYQEVKAAFGTKTELELADGTVVWLNSGSSLRFPMSFNNLDQRKVYLDGEGYFDVTKNKNKPFIVNTGEVNVKVYGTAFNVSAYSDYSSMSVALVEGKVSLEDNKSNELTMLAPNDVVECDVRTKSFNTFSNVEMEKYTAWKDGYMMFYGDPISVIIKKIEKWYNVDITIADKELEAYRFTATFHDESLEQMLDLLSVSSPMNYKIIPSEKLQNNTFSPKKIILTKSKQ